MDTEVQAKPKIGPGYYADLANDDYHAAPGISKSHLDAIANQSPMHYWHRYLNPNRNPEEDKTDATDIGSIIHTVILEPEALGERYSIEPKFDRRTKAGKEAAALFELESKGRTPIRAEDWEMVKQVRDAVHRHPVAAGLLTNGRAEESFLAVDPETGAIIKCRTDYRRDDMIIDVKSAVDASPFGFGKAAANYRYDLQPAWYFKVLALMNVQLKHFVWIAVEKEPPFAIGVYYATPELIAAAIPVAMRDYKRILDCKNKNEFPDYGAEILQLQLPGWAKR